MGGQFAMSGSAGGLTSGAVQSGNIGDAAVTSGNIASGQITWAHLASGHQLSGGITSGLIGNAAINSGNIASGTIGPTHISLGAIQGILGTFDNIASGTIGSLDIGSGQILSGNSASGQIGFRHLANASVQSGSIASGAISTFHFSSGAVLSGNIASGQIGLNHIASGAVRSGHIASGQIGFRHIANGAVQSGSVASGQITWSHLASGHQLSGGIISGLIGNNAVTSGNIASGQISTYHLASGATTTISQFSAPFMSGTAWTAITEEMISGDRAVTLSQSGTLRIAMASISGRMPAIGVVVDNVASGIPANVYTAGLFQFTSGMADYSGYLGQTIFVGRSGQIVTTSGSFNSGGLLSGNIIQPLGQAWTSGGAIIKVDYPLVDTPILTQIQTGNVTLTGTTTNVTQTEIFIGGVASSRINIASDSTYMFEVRIAARRTDADNESAAYLLQGCIDNNAGTTALVGSLNKVVLAEDTAAWDVDVQADNTNDALIVLVTGENTKTIRWTALVTIVEAAG
jgi:hypothetical protein